MGHQEGALRQEHFLTDQHGSADVDEDVVTQIRHVPYAKQCPGIGGRNAHPWALLFVGDMAYLGDDVFINICRPVLIGKEVFLTQRSLLVTHNIGHSVLEGYENRFAPIVLEDYSQIGMNCTVYAGASIGRAAIVGSNSYVISSIPAGKLAMGVPARVIRDAARPLTRERQVQIVEAMIRQYHELLSLKGYEVSPMEIPRARGFALSPGGKRFQLIFVETYQARSLSVDRKSVV